MNELVEELWKWKILFLRLNTRGPFGYNLFLLKTENTVAK